MTTEPGLPEGRRAKSGRTITTRLRRVPRKTATVLLVIVAVLVAARVSAPYAIEWYVNRKLATLPDYRGRVGDVDLSLLAGKFAVEDVRIDIRADKEKADREKSDGDGDRAKDDSSKDDQGKKEDRGKDDRDGRDRGAGERDVPLLRVDRAAVDVHWSQLFRGRIVADVAVDRPVLNILPELTKKQVEKEKEKKGPPITEKLQKMVPARIAKLEVRNGVVRFKDPKTSPPAQLRITRLNVFVANLSNRRAPKDQMPTRGRASALIEGSGRLRAQFQMNLLAKQPTFDLNVALRGLQVPELNDFLRAYAKADAEKGTASFYTELVAKNGGIRGYFKPMLQNVEMLDTEGGDKDDPWYRKAWEGAIGAVEELFENQDKDRLATRIPISGQLDQPGINVWSTVTQLIGNAFIKALVPGVEHSVGTDAPKKEQEKENKELKKDEKKSEEKKDAKSEEKKDEKKSEEKKDEKKSEEKDEKKSEEKKDEKKES